VDGVSDSPQTKPVQGYNYIVMSTGHLHWLELVFRIQGELADLGRSVGGHRGEVRTNYVGGVDLERAFNQVWPQALALIASMLADDIFWQSAPGMPLLHPSKLLAQITRFILQDGRIVLYPEEIPSVRPALPEKPTAYSQKMAKLVCIYTVLHELEHVRLGHFQRELDCEMECDDAATLLSPLFVDHVEISWNLAIGNNGVERVAARPAFFVSEQIRQLVALYIADAQQQVERVLHHLRELGTRRRRQAERLYSCVRGDHLLAEHVRQVDTEFMVIPRMVLSVLETLKPADQDAFAEARRIL